MPESSVHAAAGEAHDEHVHIVPFNVLAAVFATLLVLTVVTVAVTKVNLGNFNLWIAMAIATVKASLVVLYFMHMRYERPFNAVVFITALLIVALFIGIALIDTGAYQPELIPGYAPGMPRQ
jgi:cytochrome c oxidase subunit IV